MDITGMVIGGLIVGFGFLYREQRDIVNYLNKGDSGKQTFNADQCRQCPIAKDYAQMQQSIMVEPKTIKKEGKEQEPIGFHNNKTS